MPASPIPRPRLLIAVTSTATEVGKTWTTAALCQRLSALGYSVAARKPAQSFSPDEAGSTDAEVLAAATGVEPTIVTAPHRWYSTPLAPPMAAAQLGLDSFELADLVSELSFPKGIDIGFVEGAGGVLSPIANNAHNAHFINALVPHVVIVVADAGLGTINNVRLTAGALQAHRLVVFLNRYDPGSVTTHDLNRAWLTGRDRFDVVVTVDELVTRITAMFPPA
jgi:dethiobiotin synthetase